MALDFVAGCFGGKSPDVFFVSMRALVLYVLRNFSSRLTAHKIKFLPLRLITLEGHRIYFYVSSSVARFRWTSSGLSV